MTRTWDFVDFVALGMQKELGSTRALASFDRRLAGRNGVETQSLDGDSAGRTSVVGEGADHCTRGRVRSPSHLNSYGLAADFQNIFGSRRSKSPKIGK